jgi:hypothetical protein
MSLPWIFRQTARNRVKPRTRRSRSEFHLAVERLELRTPLASGVTSSVAYGLLSQTSSSIAAAVTPGAPSPVAYGFGDSFHVALFDPGTATSRIVARPGLSVAGPQPLFLAAGLGSVGSPSLTVARELTPNGIADLSGPVPEGTTGRVLAPDIISETVGPVAESPTTAPIAFTRNEEYLHSEVTLTASVGDSPSAADWTDSYGMWAASAGAFFHAPPGIADAGFPGNFMLADEQPPPGGDNGDGSMESDLSLMPGVPALPLLMMKIAVFRADLNSIDGDMSFAGPVSSTQSAPSVLFVTALPSVNSGRSSGPAQGGVTGGISTQIDPPGEPGLSGWMSYLATLGWSVPSFQSGAPSPAEELAGLDEASSAAMSSSSLIPGASSSILLNGPDGALQTDSANLQQVAELIPSDESSLALVATLWTVSAGTQATGSPAGSDRNDSGDSYESVNDRSQPSTTPSASTAFVIGLDQAVQETCRSARAETSSSWQSTTRELPAHDWSEWRGPVIGTSTRDISDSTRPLPETSFTSAAAVQTRDGLVLSPLPVSGSVELEAGGDDSSDATGLAHTAGRGAGTLIPQATIVSIVSIAAVSTVAMGWFRAAHKAIAADALAAHRGDRERRSKPESTARRYLQACRSLL